MKNANLKKIFAVFTAVAMVSALACNPFALDNTTSTAMTTAYTTVKSDSIESIGLLAPIAIGIFGALLAWRIGKKFFTSVAK